ncbi:unnamed protein product [Parnassius apollo]|uniref:(apollo) hypothetical protein n=1 Tax=Parnassius apollo TaxID=110799 RepID=A0A8S3W5A0_PARAO|nr:unnamed protein product [Parnassius apollo]
MCQICSIYDIADNEVNRKWAYDVDGRKFLLSHFKEIKADPNLSGKLLYKCEFEQENYYVLDICNRSSSRKRKWNGTPADVELKPAYNGPLPISKALHKDLNSLCELNAIPAYYQSFFKNLTAENDIPQDTSDED